MVSFTATMKNVTDHVVHIIVRLDSISGENARFLNDFTVGIHTNNSPVDEERTPKSSMSRT
jgi:hypothetical protein